MTERPVEKGAHFFRSLLIDAHGNHINKRNAWANRATVYVHLIPPGAADTAHYRLHIRKSAGRQSHFSHALFRNVQPIMRGVCRAGRNQVHVNRRAIGPAFRLLMWFPCASMSSDRKKCAPFSTGPFPSSSILPPRKASGPFIDSLQFQPHIESVDGAPRKKVADLARANDNIHAHIVAAAHGRIHATQGRVTARASLPGRWGDWFSASSPTANEVDSSGRPIFEAVGAGISLPAGEIARYRR